MKKKLFTSKDFKAIKNLLHIIKCQLEEMHDDYDALSQISFAIQDGNDGKRFLKAVDNTLKIGSFLNRYGFDTKDVDQLLNTAEKLEDTNEN